jgi:L-asparaginase II
MENVAVKVLRGDVVESIHRASIAISDDRGRIAASFGDPDLVTFLRSTTKPFQAIPLVETGAADAFRFSEKDLAVAVASHNGEPRHVRRVLGMLTRAGLKPSVLQCGKHAPYGAAAAKAVGSRFTSLHHNCSGKHAGLLAACVHNGWKTSTYLEAKHPAQRQILQALSQASGVPARRIALAVDGCGVPTFALPLSAAARAFARYTNSQDATLGRLRTAMIRHPDLVAGTGRIDTAFMRAFQGDVWVKAGAEACYAFGVRSLGYGGIIKIEDGNGRGMGPLLFGLLDELGLVRAKHRLALKRFWDEPMRNIAGRKVGRYESNVRLTRREAR